MKLQPYIADPAKYSKFLQKLADGSIKVDTGRHFNRGLIPMGGGSHMGSVPLESSEMSGSGVSSSIVKLVSPTAQAIQRTRAALKRSRGQKRKRTSVKVVAKKRRKQSHKRSTTVGNIKGGKRKKLSHKRRSGHTTTKSKNKRVKKKKTVKRSQTKTSRKRKTNRRKDIF